MILFLTVLVAKKARGHLGLAGITMGVSIGGATYLTIFPLWTLIVAIVFIIGGLVSERSPSL
jgi:hypothetical protein